MTRPNWFQVSAEGARALGELHTYATTGTNLSDQLVHLVFLRVSQLNGCAHCIDIHTRDLIKGGMTVDKLVGTGLGRGFLSVLGAGACSFSMV